MLLRDFLCLSSAGVAILLCADDFSLPRPRQLEYDAKGRPTDAVVLFDGRNMDQWCDKDGNPSRWQVQPDGTVLVDKTGNTPTSVVASVYSRMAFTNFQLHLEFRIPESCRKMSHPQWRGNSGVVVFGCYEIQVLGSKGQETYADGLCGAVYSRNPPLVLASKDFGQWESYDIIFHAPRVRGDEVVELARLTVLQNGVVVQDDFHAQPFPDTSETRVRRVGGIEPQSHNDDSEPIAYRNIWVRNL